MLAIRFLRSGRKNKAFFRIVLTENSRPPKSNFIKELGWFDPHSKQTSLKTEDILRYLDNGAKPSNSVAKLLLASKMKHKQIVYIPDTAKTKKGKKDGSSDKNTPVEKKETAKDADTEEPKDVTDQEAKVEAPENQEDTPALDEKLEADEKGKTDETTDQKTENTTKQTKDIEES